MVVIFIVAICTQTVLLVVAGMAWHLFIGMHRCDMATDYAFLVSWRRGCIGRGAIMNDWIVDAHVGEREGWKLLM